MDVPERITGGDEVNRDLWKDLREPAFGHVFHAGFLGVEVAEHDNGLGQVQPGRITNVLVKRIVCAFQGDGAVDVVFLKLLENFIVRPVVNMTDDAQALYPGFGVADDPGAVEIKCFYQMLGQLQCCFAMEAVIACAYCIVMDDVSIPSGFFGEPIEDAVHILMRQQRDAVVDMIMASLDGDAVVIQQLRLCLVGAIALQPFLMVTMVPEQCFVGNDQIAFESGSFADNICRGKAGGDYTCTFFIGIAEKYLVAGGSFVNDAVETACAVILNGLNDFTLLHKKPLSKADYLGG